MTAAMLRPADGPEDPPSSRPHAGVLGGQVLAFRFDPSGGEQRLPLPGGFEVAPDAVLHWAFYADGPNAALAPHAALAVTVDVVFERSATAPEARLSDDVRVRDRYGFRVTASAQFAAAWAMPEQWNADSVSLAPWTGRAARIEVVLGAAGVHADGQMEGFVEVVIGTKSDALAPPCGADLTPADRVDTRRGSHSGDRFSRGNTIPITAAPHGFCFLTPATQTADTRWPYRWSVHDDRRGRPLAAVQFSHQPSPWIGDRGVLQLRPLLGIRRLPDIEPPRIEPGGELARPHHYRARVRAARRAEQAVVELTATSHGGAFRIAPERRGDVVGFEISAPDGAGRVSLRDDGTLDGWTPEGSEDWGNAPRAYFAGIVLGEGVTAADGTLQSSGGFEVRIAQSFLSVEQARRSLAQELDPSRTFEQLRDALREQWNGPLGAVELPPLDPAERPYRGLADDEARAQLASALHRLHLYPNTMAENTGTCEQPRWRFADPAVPAGPHGDDATGAPVADGELFVNNGYWDTYRTAWPALALVDPAGAGRLLDGLLEQAHRGGWMARWSAPGYVDSMVGTSSDQIFADAERWRLPFDERGAFETAWRDACEPSGDPRNGRKGIGRARFTGYVSSEVPEGMSWSLENAMSDAAIARLAQRLADGEGGARYVAYARYFSNRSLSYRQLFDAAAGFFRGRDADGRFSEGWFDPRIWGGDNVETNAWGMSVTAVHDGAGLAGLHGGPAGLREHLDRLFAEPETADEAFGGSYGTVIHEQREARALRSGMCAISNQPAHHIPWMHVHGDQPWRAGELAAGLAGRLFTGAMIGQGLPGDEDNGEMSAWWVWAALGLYPLELASGELRIGSPLFDDITVRRAGGGSLRVRSRRTSGDAKWLTAAALDGVPLNRPVLETDALKADVVLELDFTADAVAAAASPLWTAPEAPARPWHRDLTGAGGRPLDPAHDVLFDDRADAVVALAAGAASGWCFDAPTVVTDVTITSATDIGAGALRWQASDDGVHWCDISTTHDEALPMNRTTPFAFTEPVTVRRLRVAASVAVGLRQLELFALDDPAHDLSPRICNDARKEDQK